MALKDVFKSAQNEKINPFSIAAQLETNLAMESMFDPDRDYQINSPSAMGTCLRSRYYARTGTSPDSIFHKPRSLRAMDNGTYFHSRMENYFEKYGLTHLNEVPVYDDSLLIRGHTDGCYIVNKTLVLLELKSINDRGFIKLPDSLSDNYKDIGIEKHIAQGLGYVACASKRQYELHEIYNTIEAFRSSQDERAELHALRYQYLKDGKKHTRKEKIAYMVDKCLQFDVLLYSSNIPVDTVVFLYENKNDQQFKEFVVKYSTQDLVDLKQEMQELNYCVDKKRAPEREGTKKTDYICTYCDYKKTCWG